MTSHAREKQPNRVVDEPVGLLPHVVVFQRNDHTGRSQGLALSGFPPDDALAPGLGILEYAVEAVLLENHIYLLDCARAYSLACETNHKN